MVSLSCDNSFGPYAGGCRGGFDFTLLFEESILTIPITALVLLAAPCRVLYLLHKNKVKLMCSRRVSGTNSLTTLCLGLLAAQISFLISWTRSSAVATRASLATAALSFVASIGILCLSYVEHVYSYRPSTVLILFLLLTALFDAVRTRTLWLQGYNRTAAITALIATVIKTVMLAVEAIEKRRFLRPQYRALPPEVTGSVLSHWFFSWQIPLFRAGYSKHLEIEALFPLEKHFKSLYLQMLLQTAWAKASRRGNHALMLTVLRTLKWPTLSIIFPRLCFIGFTFCQPFLISATLAWAENDSESDDMNQGYGLIGAWFLVFMGLAVTSGQYQHLTYRAITMARGQLVSILFDKATDISITAADPSAALTLMSADIERIDTGWRTAHDVWANLVEIVIAVYLLGRQLGIACLIPVGAAIFSIIGSVIAVSFVMARQAAWLEAIEKRISVTSQMLGSMKGVKMCGLTDVLSTRIHALRTDELRISGKFRRLLIWNMVLAYLAPIFAPVLTFATYSLVARSRGGDNNLDINRMFTSLSLFALLSEPISSFVTALSSLMGSVGSFARIQTFLNTDIRVDGRIISPDNKSEGSLTPTSLRSEQEKDSISSEKQPNLQRDSLFVSSLDGSCIVVKTGAFGYDTTQKPILSDITTQVPMGKLTLIVGPVGSGKSTLLRAFLGEVAVMAGSIQMINSEIAYCDQTPWHMNGTVRDSIIAFSHVDERWYQKVLHACSLTEDLAQLPKGDLSRIGSKGIVLSGGQSQRVSLARAVYAQKKIVILDDVFSGLDMHTENAVFHNLLGTHGLLRQTNTTVIMATSRANRLSYADQIISLDGTGIGCVQGSFDKLTNADNYVSRLAVASADWTYTQATASPPSTEPSDALLDSEVVLSEEAREDAGRRTGDMAIYLYYIRAIGWIPSMIFIFAICAFIVCQSFPTIWLNWWAAANAKKPFARLGYYLGIYAMLGGLAIIFLVVSTWQMIVTMVPLSGNSFHQSLLKTVLNAPMSFFAATDAGVTINRFSQDLQLVDMDLPLSALNTFATFVLCIAEMVLISVGSYYTAIAFPFLFVALWVVQHTYLRTSRQLRFMDLEAKSPLYALFTESVAGLATLRAFGWRDALEKKHHDLLDQSQRPFYLLYAAQRWLTLVLDLFVTVIAVLVVVLVTQLRGVLPTGLIGVALVNIIQFSQHLKLLMTFWTTLETHIGAISRIKSFTSDTASEHEPQEKEQPPSIWPSKGQIVFDNVSAGYTPSENVLKDISLSIEAGQKIGICGRTGSGKSSMVSCLFRMVDLHNGKILVDGLDISTLPRQEVRARLVGVPQDAFLIEGSSVRLNADPAQGLSDAAIEDAMRAVELWDIIADKGGLDAPIDALHLSHGQKQLFCIARAILRPSPIVVLDEATSSVDSRVDELVQRVVRERFENRTVIEIVHKIQSALEDFDMVAVLDKGELLEFGPPRQLLAKGAGESAFAALYESLEYMSSTAGCNSGKDVTIKAPVKNIFQSLTDEEYAHVTAYLHEQKDLNLTAVVNSTSWDNVIVSLDLLQPNKTYALAYLEGHGPAPVRYARATLQFNSKVQPYIQEYMVGPLPVQQGLTHHEELNYMFTSGRGRINVYNADSEAIAAFNLKIGAEIKDITKNLLNGTATGAKMDNLLIAGSDPLIHRHGRVYQWNEFYSAHTGEFYSETVLPTSLQFKVDLTGRDPSKWKVVGWYYDGHFWPTTAAFRKGIKTLTRKPGPVVDGPWTSTDQQGDSFPRDDLFPPVPVQPDGPRFGVDREQNYVEWMDFSFFLSNHKETGLQLHDVRFKGERVIYEFGLQEALAHYASQDPLHASSAYLDSSYGIGTSQWNLVDGFDCPSHATYLNTTFYISETTHVHPNSLCLFEYDTGYPIQRHLTMDHVSATKNIVFTVRSVSTVGNYDYLFEYTFHYDGSIAVTVRASGYIQGAFWSGDGDYGYHIHDNLSGSMHDHVINFKLDLDIKGRKNSLMKTEFVPHTQVYPWSDSQPINTMKVNHSYIASEDDGKINWSPNGATSYSVVNRDKLNDFGEAPGYSITPNSGSTAHLTVKSSSALGQAANWANHNLYALQHHDTEPKSAYAFNSHDLHHPAVDFNKFFNGESLDQEDIVLYFNLGMHHLPNTADLPNTVTTKAVSSMMISPQNYFAGDVSRRTVHQVRMSFDKNSNVTEVKRFGVKQPTCALDMNRVAPDLSNFVGEIEIPKFPWNPSGSLQTNPGG
ncbi:multidrug resistance [Fusarium phyllophilum]|uniref:Multidrug resistance n=1 Tax=Fusarium phyllophilum TaxID=47803 RepID=A0A8H5NG72_9HYPO|nr:multidrug resistance [Fusarium phyllophilum]